MTSYTPKGAQFSILVAYNFTTEVLIDLIAKRMI
jgi:hypothetical protein